ncbi:MAG: adenylyl-sulfate kinase [Bdellovibrionaceae bacterium]|nr:adenylyl-sulfate kinase [Bdellovibrionales bacterium]MCB9255200.1 adenylyl-sulfate kinase [Pseudobdellovibrionaceae bacterium]
MGATTLKKQSQPDLSREPRPQMDIVVVGHVDHGKSTIVGRLLADTNSLPDGKLERIKAYCQNNSKPFEYAFLIDALNDERKQGITIDAARVFFKSESRDYLILDAPGHIEFVRNMVTGASRAQAALLVIDVKEGIRENSLRHGYLLSLLGVKQIVVLVNKMDQVKYSQKVFNEISNEYSKFLSSVDVLPKQFIPVSGFHGDNLTTASPNTPWYRGVSVLGALENFVMAEPADELPLRLPVQGIYKFTESGDQRRIIAGTVQTGHAKAGDEVFFSPSGKKSRIKSIEAFNATPDSIRAGEAVGITLEDELYVRRGEIVSLVSTPPQIGKRFTSSLFWLGKEPVRKGDKYLLKSSTTAVDVVVEEIKSVFDAGAFRKSEKKEIGSLEAGKLTLLTKSAIPVDLAAEGELASRFVLVSNHRLSGGGQFLSIEPDDEAPLREKVTTRNIKWHPSKIPPQKRAEQYGQRSSLVLITGEKTSDRQALAEALEGALFQGNKIVYYLKMGNVVHGLDGDLASSNEYRSEHLRRMAEIVNLFLEAGIILIVTAAELTREELENIYTVIGRVRIQTVWLGKRTTDFNPDLHFGVSKAEGVRAQVNAVARLMKDRGIVWDPDKK